MISRIGSIIPTSDRRKRVYLALFVLTARVWIDEVTEAVHRSRDLAERVEQLETTGLPEGERIRLQTYDEMANAERVADFRAAGAEVADDGTLIRPAPRPVRDQPQA